MDSAWKSAALILLSTCFCEGTEPPPIIHINNSRNVILFEYSGQERMLPLVEGHSYNLRCVGERTMFNPHWFRGSNPISDSADLTINNFSILMHSGTYHCIVDPQIVSVRILAGNPVVVPRVEVDYQRINTLSNLRLSTIMFVDSEPSGWSWKWLYNGNEELPMSDFIKNGRELVFPHTVTQSLSGNYTLQVSNSAGTTKGSTYVFLTDNPLVSILPAMSVSVSASECLSLQCVTNISAPPATFQWTVNGVPINTSDYKYVLRDMSIDGLPGLELEVLSPTVADSGRYSCTADNSYRDVSSSTTLVAYVNVTGPLPPIDFSVSQLSDCMVDVIWRDQTNTGNYSVAPSDAYSIQIQYVTSSGPVVLDFLSSNMTTGTGRVRYVQQNTTFMLRGRGTSYTHGPSSYSNWFGPFKSFSMFSFPKVVVSYESMQRGLVVTKRLEGNDCYQLEDFKAKCVESKQLVIPIFHEGETIAGRIHIGSLRDNTYYNCTVTWRFSVAGVDGNTMILPPNVDPFSTFIMARTLPKVMKDPATMKPLSPKSAGTINLTQSYITLILLFIHQKVQ